MDGAPFSDLTQIRRKPAFLNTSASITADPCLGKEQILDLFQNCIKLASENKINQKNTWELNLIDHLCDIIKVEEEDDSETNFQKITWMGLLFVDLMDL
ncbi:hypothetical protein ACS0TY_036498 [Phlomoides rotata]